MSTVETPAMTIQTHWGAADVRQTARWEEFCVRCGESSPSRRIEWLAILRDGLDHQPVLIEAAAGSDTLGMLPLEFLESRLFGRFLVGLPYLNSGGVLTADANVAAQLIDAAVKLADELDVKHLELRHEKRANHRAFNHELTEKVHLRLPLPESSEELWKNVGPKVRNQIRKAEKEGVVAEWGRDELLREFYDVYSHNMRDLGTPVFSHRLFAAILRHLGTSAEICVARYRNKAVAAALLIHGNGMTEVPSASSLRRWNHLNGNMLVYWELLKRTIERGQQVFDFGRSSADSNTYRFKSQWGAQPHPAVWQYYVRHGSVGEMRPNHPKNQRRIAVWKKLPVWLTRIAGPPIVRGIP